ncbi:MAG: hypothetical protein Greene101449_653 [Candidatus Peregrinibacteria bacterium Greene1014_49]|nr:MAG: hypothetical protein Greene101449_653 [Candidatus Peregrinibacteria bacterium Greene1014_49]
MDRSKKSNPHLWSIEKLRRRRPNHSPYRHNNRKLCYLAASSMCLYRNNPGLSHKPHPACHKWDLRKHYLLNYNVIHQHTAACAKPAQRSNHTLAHNMRSRSSLLLQLHFYNKKLDRSYHNNLGQEIALEIFRHIVTGECPRQLQLR